MNSQKDQDKDQVKIEDIFYRSPGCLKENTILDVLPSEKGGPITYFQIAYEKFNLCE